MPKHGLTFRETPSEEFLARYFRTLTPARLDSISRSRDLNIIISCSYVKFEANTRDLHLYTYWQ